MTIAAIAVWLSVAGWCLLMAWAAVRPPALPKAPPTLKYSPRDEAELEHVLLSPEYMAWAAESGMSNHDDCRVCHPMPVASGVVIGRSYQQRIVCILCNEKLLGPSNLHVNNNYEQHLRSAHGHLV